MDALFRHQGAQNDLVRRQERWRLERFCWLRFSRHANTPSNQSNHWPLFLRGLWPRLLFRHVYFFFAPALLLAALPFALACCFILSSAARVIKSRRAVRIVQPFSSLPA